MSIGVLILEITLLIMVFIQFWMRQKNKLKTKQIISDIIIAIFHLIIIGYSVILCKTSKLLILLLIISFVIWLCVTYTDFKINNNNTRGFDFVKKEFKKDISLNSEPLLPVRADKGSAGYDFYAPKKYECKPHEVTKIWTEVKAYMQQDEVLLIDVRSSMGGKFHLANTIGIIDSTYYNNSSNDGNIGIFLVNDTDETITIKKGERIAQGIFTKYLTVDKDCVLFEERIGGFGSSNGN